MTFLRLLTKMQVTIEIYSNTRISYLEVIARHSRALSSLWTFKNLTIIYVKSERFMATSLEASFFFLVLIPTCLFTRTHFHCISIVRAEILERNSQDASYILKRKTARWNSHIRLIFILCNFLGNLFSGICATVGKTRQLFLQAQEGANTFKSFSDAPKTA